jgi:beta-lactamase superfamily II metal-dependent hydrolase
VGEDGLTYGAAPAGAEISIHGPGYGESALVCLAPECWLVVDSCVHPDLEEPSPLTYLRGIGLDPEKVVRMIVVSHWHDDHIRGAGRLVELCPKARVVLSSMIRREEFARLVAAYLSKYDMESSGVTEMAKVLDALLARPRREATPEWALASRRLFTMDAPWPVEIWSLSPSDFGVNQAILSLGAVIEPGKPKVRVPDLSPNSTSIVLWIRIGNRVLLLGSDLERGADEALGWNAILADMNRPRESALAFKVPHHGAKSGYHEDVWTTMLHPEPIALIAPFRLGSQSLPSRTDADRILRHTSRAFLTASQSSLSQKQRRDSTVERTIRETVHFMATTPFSRGLVRVRFDPATGAEPTVETLHGAVSLQDAFA